MCGFASPPWVLPPTLLPWPPLHRLRAGWVLCTLRRPHGAATRAHPRATCMCTRACTHIHTHTRVHHWHSEEGAPIMSSGDRGATQALLGGEGPLVPRVLPRPALCTGMRNVLQLHPLLATPPKSSTPQSQLQPAGAAEHLVLASRAPQDPGTWGSGHPQPELGTLGCRDGYPAPGLGIQDQGWAPETRDRHPRDQGQTPVPSSVGGAWGRGVKRRPPVPGSFPVYFLPY